MERTGSIARPPPARKPSSSSYLASAGAPAGSIYDLPTATAMADLELIPVESRKTLNSLDYNYRGGGGLGPSRSRGGQRDATSADIAIRETEGDETIVVRGMGEDDDKEKSSVADEEAGVTEHDVVVLETEARAKAMYARFTPRKKSIISAIVSFAAVLARERLSLSRFSSTEMLGLTLLFHLKRSPPHLSFRPYLVSLWTSTRLLQY